MAVVLQLLCAAGGGNRSFDPETLLLL